MRTPVYSALVAVCLSLQSYLVSSWPTYAGDWYDWNENLNTAYTANVADASVITAVASTAYTASTTLFRIGVVEATWNPRESGNLAFAAELAAMHINANSVANVPVLGSFQTFDISIHHIYTMWFGTESMQILRAAQNTPDFSVQNTAVAKLMVSLGYTRFGAIGTALDVQELQNFISTMETQAAAAGKTITYTSAVIPVERDPTSAEDFIIKDASAKAALQTILDSPYELRVIFTCVGSGKPKSTLHLQAELLNMKNDGWIWFAGARASFNDVDLTRIANYEFGTPIHNGYEYVNGEFGVVGDINGPLASMFNTEWAANVPTWMASKANGATSVPHNFWQTRLTTATTMDLQYVGEYLWFTAVCAPFWFGFCFTPSPLPSADLSQTNGYGLFVSSRQAALSSTAADYLQTHICDYEGTAVYHSLCESARMTYDAVLLIAAAISEAVTDNGNVFTITPRQVSRYKNTTSEPGFSETPTGRAPVCSTGQSVIQSNNSCAECPPGTYGVYKTLYDTYVCEGCETGRWTNSSGSTVGRSVGFLVGTNTPFGGTQALPPRTTTRSFKQWQTEGSPASGTVSTDARDSCSTCSQGFFSAEGEGSCTACSRGSFANATGTADSCTSCAATYNTTDIASTDESDCICLEGFYLNKLNNTCTECPVEANCPGGNDIPTTKFGYWAVPPADNATFQKMDIYSCLPAGACPGGLPGTCAGNREGIACGDCKPGYAKGGSLQVECDPCDTGTNVGVVFLLLILFALVGPALYKASSTPVSQKALSTMMISTALSLLLSFGQTLSVFDGMAVSWPPVMGNLFSGMDILVFDLSAVKANCVSGGSLLIHQVTNTLTPFLLLVSIFLWYGITVLADPLLKRVIVEPDQDLVEEKYAKENRKRWHIITWAKLKRFMRSGPMNIDLCINASGMGVSILYIGIVKVTLSLFNCRRNPNGISTVRDFTAVECYQEEWMSVLPVAIVGVLIWIVAVNTILIYATIRGPALSQDPRWAARLKFLFLRFRPDRYYWGIVLQTRSALLAAPPVIFPDMPATQICWQFFLISSIMVGTGALAPWNSKINTVLDVGISFACICIILVGALYQGTVEVDTLSLQVYGDQYTPSSEPQFLSNFSLVILIGAFSFTGLLIIYISRSVLFPGRRTQEKKDAKIRGMAFSLLQTAGVISKVQHEKLVGFMYTLNDHDRNAMQNAVDLLHDSIVFNYSRRASNMRQSRGSILSHAHSSISSKRVTIVPKHQYSLESDQLDVEHDPSSINLGNRASLQGGRFSISGILDRVKRGSITSAQGEEAIKAGEEGISPSTRPEGVSPTHQMGRLNTGRVSFAGSMGSQGVAAAAAAQAGGAPASAGQPSVRDLEGGNRSLNNSQSALLEGSKAEDAMLEDIADEIDGANMPH
uniref:Tyrosine-protein kinase ephrin type A/B receptor-like domain-containing protein n=1 Tax=Chromera velia CCMP2878 TaxID=1169474 RepID=A0A0G4H9C7_9ALVE|eukprot:Cvel_25368.t1-p1 / transcript=Cvel_25368.t1 / gene=Cvel_25368 / organism=Chromera_velia_CCMP2878 / gene_product=hypothetical protein / transcript_product=hypothetical protein / location=Cvel_scaffold2864:4138-16264(-) / protein_length=1396 / sequence_SO=supercontig / SO=protein_coding / is_pseudo=false